MVDAGQVSGDAIYLADQLAGRAGPDQILAAEDIINALGDRARSRIKWLGTVSLDDIQGDTEIFEIQWSHISLDNAVRTGRDRTGPTLAQHSQQPQKNRT